MNRCVFAVIFLAVAIGCYGQTQSPSPASASPPAVGHGSFPVKLVNGIDSSKLKEGDVIEAETAGSFKLPDGTLVPKASKLSGHVTASKARSKGDSESELAITFEKLNVASGKQLSIKGSIQALFPPQEDAAPMMAGKATNSGGGSSLGGGDVGTVTNATVGSNTDATSQPGSVMNPKSVGVHDLHGLKLNDGVVSSKGKNVKLSSGVRMILRVDILG